MPIMVVEGNDLWKKRDMSPLRRFCLIASVLLCITTIIVFLYVLPCDNSMVCPSINEPQPFISWDKTLQGVGKCNESSRYIDVDVKKILNSYIKHYSVYSIIV